MIQYRYTRKITGEWHVITPPKIRQMVKREHAIIFDTDGISFIRFDETTKNEGFIINGTIYDSDYILKNPEKVFVIIQQDYVNDTIESLP